MVIATTVEAGDAMVTLAEHTGVPEMSAVANGSIDASQRVRDLGAKALALPCAAVRGARRRTGMGAHNVIRPKFEPWSSCKLGGAPLPDGFAYASDTNTRMLSVEQPKTRPHRSSAAAGRVP